PASTSRMRASPTSSSGGIRTELCVLRAVGRSVAFGDHPGQASPALTGLAQGREPVNTLPLWGIGRPVGPVSRMRPHFRKTAEVASHSLLPGPSVDRLGDGEIL